MPRSMPMILPMTCVSSTAELFAGQPKYAPNRPSRLGQDRFMTAQRIGRRGQSRTRDFEAASSSSFASIRRATKTRPSCRPRTSRCKKHRRHEDADPDEATLRRSDCSGPQPGMARATTSRARSSARPANHRPCSRAALVVMPRISSMVIVTLHAGHAPVACTLGSACSDDHSGVPRLAGHLLDHLGERGVLDERAVLGARPPHALDRERHAAARAAQLAVAERGRPRRRGCAADSDSSRREREPRHRDDRAGRAAWLPGPRLPSVRRASSMNAVSSAPGARPPAPCVAQCVDLAGQRALVDDERRAQHRRVAARAARADRSTGPRPRRPDSPCSAGRLGERAPTRRAAARTSPARRSRHGVASRRSTSDAAARIAHEPASCSRRLQPAAADTRDRTRGTARPQAVGWSRPARPSRGR